MKAHSFLYVLFASLLSASVCIADDPSSEENVQLEQAIRLLDEWAEATLILDRIPGASLGFVSDQRLIWSKGFVF